MTSYRILFINVVLVAFWARVWGCGGQTTDEPLGTLDDSGTFHAPDGRVVFSPGSACTEYDAVAYFATSSDPPDCNDPVDGTFESASCEAWAAATHLTFSFQPFAQCIAGKCTNFSNLVDTALGSCHAGPSGDAYCAALYQQFVLDGQHVSYFCNPYTSSCVSKPASCNPAKVALIDGGVVVQADGGGVLPTVEIIKGDASVCALICTP